MATREEGSGQLRILGRGRAAGVTLAGLFGACHTNVYNAVSMHAQHKVVQGGTYVDARHLWFTPRKSWQTFTKQQGEVDQTLPLL